MSAEEHVHGPDCADALVVGPFTRPPVGVVVLIRLADGSIDPHVESTLPRPLLAQALRDIADKLDQQYRATLS